MTALAGMLIGLFVLMIFTFPEKFTYYFIGGIIILFIAVLTGRFKRFFQGLLIFIIPINFAHQFFPRQYEFGKTGLAISPLDIVLALLYIIWLYELILKRSGNFKVFSSVVVPAYVLVVISALSMFEAADPYITLFETIALIKFILLILYVANHFISKKDISFVLVMIVSGLFLQCLISFSQRWLGVSLGLQFFGEYQEMSTVVLDYYLMAARVGGTIGHPNILARYINLLIPLPIALLFGNMRFKYKIFSGLVAVCAFITLILTLSRAGWVCFAGSGVLLLFLLFRSRLMNLKTLLVILFLSVFFAIVMLGFAGLIRSRLLSDDYGAAYSRVQLNRIAWNVIRANPLLGVGVKNYGKVMYLYNPNVETMYLNLVHNTYLLKAAEMGIIGMLVFVWFLGSAFLRGLANIKTNDIFLRSVNIGLLAGMAGLWAHWMVAPDYLSRTSMLAVFIGLVIASGRIIQADEISRRYAAETSLQ